MTKRKRSIMPTDQGTYQDAFLVLPRLRVQNANAISSPMTWGFPSTTAFIGLMHALARHLGDADLEFRGVGIICHDYEAQVTEGGYTRSFRMTRNPIGMDGGTLAIVEEGRINLDITLLFLVNLAAPRWAETERQQLADKVNDILTGMRIAGGSVLPSLPDSRGHGPRAQLRLLPDTEIDRRIDFRRMRRRWLPGFALVARDDLLHSHLAKLQEADESATVLDAWLDLSRRNHYASRTTRPGVETGEVKWVTERHRGWMVPLPVGYVGLSELHDAGTVARARDMTTPFRFVESVYSIGQWISPHRLTDVTDLLWYGQYDEKVQLYRCCNDFAGSSSATDVTAGREQFN